MDGDFAVSIAFTLLQRDKKYDQKSEMLICDLLDSAGLDYEYEKPLKLKMRNRELIYVHPDFTFSILMEMRFTGNIWACSAIRNTGQMR